MFVSPSPCVTTATLSSWFTSIPFKVGGEDGKEKTAEQWQQETSKSWNMTLLLLWVKLNPSEKQQGQARELTRAVIVFKDCSQ